MLKAVVGPDGVPCFILCEYASPSGLGFAEAALRAAADYRYRPGLIDGEPQAVWVEIPFYWDQSAALAGAPIVSLTHS